MPIESGQSGEFQGRGGRQEQPLLSVRQGRSAEVPGSPGSTGSQSRVESGIPSENGC